MPRGARRLLVEALVRTLPCILAQRAAKSHKGCARPHPLPPLPPPLPAANTGLQFSSDASTVRDAIRALKAAQPNTRVLIAVGGATYTNFAGMNTQCIKDVIADFGFDGADLDWEPSTAACTVSGSTVSCPTDAEAVAAVTTLRSALPKGQFILSTASFHVGLYGEGAFAASKPASGYRGIDLAMAKSPAGQGLDLINIMSYGARGLRGGGEGGGGLGGARGGGCGPVSARA